MHLTWKRCISNGLTGSCKICSIFMPRLGMNLARLCAKSCQNVMVSHGKSWQDLANFFLRVGQMNGMSDLASLENKSIRARVDTLQRTYHSMPDKVQQLLSIMKEQLLSLPHVTWRQSHSRLVTYQTHKHQTILPRRPV